MRNERDALQQRITQLEQEKRSLEVDIQSIKIEYPRIFLGECSNTRVYDAFSNLSSLLINCTKSLAECDARIRMLEEAQLGKYIFWHECLNITITTGQQQAVSSLQAGKRFVYSCHVWCSFLYCRPNICL